MRDITAHPKCPDHSQVLDTLRAAQDRGEVMRYHALGPPKGLYRAPRALAWTRSDDPRAYHYLPEFYR